MDLRYRVRLTAVSLIAVLTLGTLGYCILEGWGFLDSLYMTVITLTTVGYMEVHPLQWETRLFTILLIFLGMGVVVYALGTFTQALVEGQIRDLLGRRKLRQRISSLQGHCIVCGFGRIGQSVCRELSQANMPFVVVEADPKHLEKIEQEGYLGVLGDATSEETLKEARIERARALIPAASSDADNVYITLTARGMNNQLTIIARAAEFGAEKKLLWAGADRVVSPYQMSGQRMANLLLRPAVVEFIESSLFDPTLDLVMEEIHLSQGCDMAGQSIQSSGLRRDYNVSVVAIKRKEGGILINPSPGEALLEGDILIALGRRGDFRIISQRLGVTDGAQA